MKHDIEKERSFNKSLLELHSFDEVQQLPQVIEQDVSTMSYFQVWKHIGIKALPLYLASIANVGSFTIVFSWVSRVSADSYIIGAIGLGNMTMNLFLRSYVLGFNMGLITLLSQAFGAGHYKRMGTIINRSKIMLTVLMMPLLVIMYFIGSILILLGQSEKLSINTQKYVRISMFLFFGQLHFDFYRKLLNSMKLFYVHAPIPYVTLILHIFWWYLFIIYCSEQFTGIDFVLYGAGITVIIQAMTNYFIIYFSVHCLGYGKVATTSITSEAMKGWWEIFQMGLPSYFLQLFSFISIEIVTLLSSLVDVEILVANTALVNLLYLLFLYIYALSQSWSAMIGNKIGEGDKEGARKLINANNMFGGSFAIFITCGFYAFKPYLFSIYTTNPSILDKMDKISYAFSFSLAAYMIKEVFVSILIGLGLQRKTLVFNIWSYLLVGIPISIFWTFWLKWEYSGPWIGLGIAIISNAIYYYWLYSSHDLQFFIDEYKNKHYENS
jgi:multidrug resistance protein, MATE family